MAYWANVRIGPKLPAWTMSALRGHWLATAWMAVDRRRQSGALTAEFLRDAQPEQPLLRQQAGDVARIVASMGPGQRIGRELISGEADDRFAELARASLDR